MRLLTAVIHAFRPRPAWPGPETPNVFAGVLEEWEAAGQPAAQSEARRASAR